MIGLWDYFSVTLLWTFHSWPCTLGQLLRALRGVVSVRGRASQYLEKCFPTKLDLILYDVFLFCQDFKSIDSVTGKKRMGCSTGQLKSLKDTLLPSSSLIYYLWITTNVGLINHIDRKYIYIHISLIFFKPRPESSTTGEMTSPFWRHNFTGRVALAAKA